MHKQKETFRCEVIFDCGEQSSYANIDNLLEFISFINGWFVDWEVIKVFSELSGDFVEQYHVDDYLYFEGIDYNPEKWVDFSSWDY